MLTADVIKIMLTSVAFKMMLTCNATDIMMTSIVMQLKYKTCIAGKGGSTLK